MKTPDKKPANMEHLLNEAAKRLGISPNVLEQQLKNGELSAALKNMPKQQQEQLTKTLSDKAACERLMHSPQAQALIRKLSGK